MYISLFQVIMEENPICNQEYVDIFERLETEKMNSQEIEFVTKLLQLYYPLFTLHCFDPFPNLQHRITTINHQPFQHNQTPPNSYSSQQKQDIQLQLFHLTYARIMAPAISKYNNPILTRLMWIPPSQRFMWKFSVDFTYLNSLIINSPSEFQPIEEIRVQIDQANFLSIFDLMELYCRIEIYPPDSYKTAFTTPAGKYKFNRLAPTIMNSESSFNKLLNKIFPDAPKDDIIFYPKGLIVASQTLTSHMESILKIFHIFSINKITIDSAQCKLFLDKIDAHDFLDNEMEVEHPIIIPNPSYTGQLILYFEILEKGIRTILAEYNTNNTRLIAKSNRIFQQPEITYSYHEKTCLALIHSKRRFNQFIGNNPILLPNGHHALNWLNTVNTPTIRQRQWMLELNSEEWILTQYN